MNSTTDDNLTQYDTGETGFMIIAAALVVLMTPGLAFFYGGLVSRRVTVTLMMQSFLSMGVTSVIWWCFGYSLAFSGNVGRGIIGNLKRAFTIGMTSTTPSPFNPRIPELVFYVYQLAFAIITPALISGAFVGRVRFRAYLVFISFWLVLVYIPWAHWIWGGGWAAEWGVLDFAGGIVVHATAGTSAAASVLYVGPRKKREGEAHSLPLVAIGTGLLWFGWYGFNAGSAIAVNGAAALAFFNTSLAASIAGIVWLSVDWFVTKKPKFLGFLTGAVAGLATITPGSGYVQPWAAFSIGFIAGAICYVAAYVFKQKLKLDDTLDVTGVHGVGGVVGTLLLGCLATPSANPYAGYVQEGLFYGGALFFGKQVAAVSLCVVHSFVFTYLMLFIIDKVFKMKISEEENQENLDGFEHGEAAYIDAGSSDSTVVPIVEDGTKEKPKPENIEMTETKK